MAVQRKSYLGLFVRSFIEWHTHKLLLHGHPPPPRLVSHLLLPLALRMRSLFNKMSFWDVPYRNRTVTLVTYRSTKVQYTFIEYHLHLFKVYKRNTISKVSIIQFRKISNNNQYQLSILITTQLIYKTDTIINICNLTSLSIERNIKT